MDRRMLLEKIKKKIFLLVNNHVKGSRAYSKKVPPNPRVSSTLRYMCILALEPILYSHA